MPLIYQLLFNCGYLNYEEHDMEGVDSMRITHGKSFIILQVLYTCCRLDLIS